MPIHARLFQDQRFACWVNLSELSRVLQRSTDHERVRVSRRQFLQTIAAASVLPLSAARSAPAVPAKQRRSALRKYAVNCAVQFFRFQPLSRQVFRSMMRPSARWFAVPQLLG